jgi:hypothetical protein
MTVRAIDNDSWFWPLVVVLFSAALRAGRDSVVSLYNSAFGEMS